MSSRSQKWKFTPRNRGQEELVEALGSCDLVFALGPAGTGKTVGAVGLALQHVLAKRISRIVIARPTVGAGESNGFLPGTIEEKLRPYMMPIYDALQLFSTQEGIPGFVEMVSFEHLRGRSLNDSFIIVDEAQNATFSQLELAITRLGSDSKMIIAADPAQSDLNGKSGLLEMVDIASKLNRVAVVRFLDSYCLRHSLVADLSRAIAKHKASKCKQFVPTQEKQSAQTESTSASIVKPGSEETLPLN